MSTQELIQSLKDEACKNPVASAVFTAFGARKRARGIITMNGLVQRMEKGGFKFTADEYASVLKLLSEKGIGHLDKDSKGRVRALKDIKVSLVSLGEAVCNQSEASALKGFRKRNKFQKLPVQEAAPKAEATMTPVSLKTDIEITVRINDKPVGIKIPNNINNQELAALLAKFQAA